MKDRPGPRRRWLVAGMPLLVVLAIPGTVVADDPLFADWTLKQLVQASAVVVVVNKARPPLTTRVITLRVPGKRQPAKVTQTFYRFEVLEVLHLVKSQFPGGASPPAPKQIIEVEHAEAYWQHLSDLDKRGRFTSQIQGTYGPPQRPLVPSAAKSILFLVPAEKGAYAFVVSGAYEELTAKRNVLRTIHWVQKHPTAPVVLPSL